MPSAKAVKPFKVGSQVQWKWLGRAIIGTVKEIHKEPITKLIKGKNIKRNGSPEKPAYLVESEAGNLALKLQTELESATKKEAASKRPTPKMFS